MNKLENEYKQLMQSETPDLWSRIEAGVDAKIATGEQVARGQIASENAEVVNTDEVTKNAEKVNTDEITKKVETSKQNKVFVINWKKYSLPLVACIAAIVCVPLLLTGFIRMACGTKGAMETEDCAMVETTTTTMDCVAEETIEESAIEYATETSMDNAADIEESFMEETCEEEMAEAEDYVTQATESNADDNMTESAVEEYDNAKSANVESADADNADTGGTGANKQIKEEVSQVTHILTVTEIAVFDEKSAGSHEGGTVYYIVTEEKGECTLFVPDDTEFQIDMNGQFTIKAETTNEWYDYVLIEVL